IKLEKTKDSKATNLPFEDAVPSYEWRNRLFIKPQAGNFFESGAYLAMSGKEIGPLPISKNVVGNYLHEALAHVSNTSELLGWVKNAHLEGIINTQVMDQLIARAELIIQDEELNNLLNSSTNVLNERVIITKDTFQQKRPDRVQFTDNEVICIDFKTGEASKKHNAQIATYMELLQDMYPDKQVLGKLVYITESELNIENVVANNKEVV
ncbi:MAG: PD-(D/E)XK nuclease family protein, partial [Flexibacteraceae bacterium]